MAQEQFISPKESDIQEAEKTQKEFKESLDKKSYLKANSWKIEQAFKVLDSKDSDWLNYELELWEDYELQKNASDFIKEVLQITGFDLNSKDGGPKSIVQLNEAINSLKKFVEEKKEVSKECNSMCNDIKDFLPTKAWFDFATRIAGIDLPTKWGWKCWPWVTKLIKEWCWIEPLKNWRNWWTLVERLLEVSSVPFKNWHIKFETVYRATPFDMLPWEICSYSAWSPWYKSEGKRQNDWGFKYWHTEICDNNWNFCSDYRTDCPWWSAWVRKHFGSVEKAKAYAKANPEEFAKKTWFKHEVLQLKYV